MTREGAKQLLPIIKAFAENKPIERRTIEATNWADTNQICLQLYEEKKIEYRIKPEPKYRPFKTKEECWNEMLKHQPFGWVKHKVTCGLIVIGAIDESLQIASATFDMESLFNNYIFADGAPFGIKED